MIILENDNMLYVYCKFVNCFNCNFMYKKDNIVWISLFVFIIFVDIFFFVFKNYDYVEFVIYNNLFLEVVLLNWK